jgi:hypothetical protein
VPSNDRPPWNHPSGETREREKKQQQNTIATVDGREKFNYMVSLILKKEIARALGKRQDIILSGTLVPPFPVGPLDAHVASTTKAHVCCVFFKLFFSFL